MAKAGNAKSGFGAGSMKMGGPGMKPMMGSKPSIAKPMPPGMGSPSPMGPGAGGPMGAYKKGGPVAKMGKAKPFKGTESKAEEKSELKAMKKK